MFALTKKSVLLFLFLGVMILLVFFVIRSSKKEPYKNSLPLALAEGEPNLERSGDAVERKPSPMIESTSTPRAEDTKTVNKTLLTREGKSFFPESIVRGKVAIGKHREEVLSSVAYLKKPESFFSMDGPKLVYAHKMPGRNYFDSMTVFFVEVNGVDTVDRIQLTRSMKHQSDQDLEYNNNEFIQYCYSAWGHPDQKYLVSLRIHNSDQKVYSSALFVWMKW